MRTRIPRYILLRLQQATPAFLCNDHAPASPTILCTDNSSRRLCLTTPTDHALHPSVLTIASSVQQGIPDGGLLQRVRTVRHRLSLPWQHTLQARRWCCCWGGFDMVLKALGSPALDHVLHCYPCFIACERAFKDYW